MLGADLHCPAARCTRLVGKDGPRLPGIVNVLVALYMVVYVQVCLAPHRSPWLPMRGSSSSAETSDRAAQPSAASFGASGLAAPPPPAAKANLKSVRVSQVK